MSRLLDVEQITKNMRVNRTGTRSTVAEDFKPYMVSELGFLVHRTLGVRLDWKAGQIRSVLGVAMCGEATFYARFFDSEPHQDARHQLTRRCKGCFR